MSDVKQALEKWRDGADFVWRSAGQTPTAEDCFRAGYEAGREYEAASERVIAEDYKEWRDVRDRQKDAQIAALQDEKDLAVAQVAVLVMALERTHKIATTDITNLPVQMICGDIAASCTAALADPGLAEAKALLDELNAFRARSVVK